VLFTTEDIDLTRYHIMYLLESSGVVFVGFLFSTTEVVLGVVDFVKVRLSFEFGSSLSQFH